MAGQKAHIAISALVIAKDSEGHDVYVYQGQPIPASISGDEIARLLDGGYIASIGEDEEPEFPEGTPDDSWTVKQMRAYAAHNSIDLGSATSKPDVLAAVI